MSLISMANGKRKRVVIVDDSRTIQAVMEQILSLRLGLDVVGLASDVETAISMIASLRPDLVTIELHLPYIDGKALLEQLADFPAMHKIVVSSHACNSLTMVSTLEQLGADMCIDKMEMSRDPARFCEKILSVLDRPKRGAILPGSPTAAETAPTAPVLVAANRYPIPADERARLTYLDAMDLANDDEETQFDRLTTHLGLTTDFPTCLMTFIDRDKQWVKSAHGFSRGSMPRALAFCNYTLCADDTLVVPDATLDERFSSNLLVTETPRLRTYVGHPITSKSGVRIGAICLLDTQPRRISKAITTNLRGICEIAAGIIDARSVAMRAVA